MNTATPSILDSEVRASRSVATVRDRSRPLRVCMVAYTFYENDGRVMRYAEALAQEGAEVDAIVLAREGQPRDVSINGVRVLRVQTRQKNERSKLAYLTRIGRFFLRSMFELSRRHWTRSYDLIHVHSVPDFEVFAALLPKLSGARVILDIHDIVPEFYAAKFGVGHDSLVFKALKLVERGSAAFADHVIIANDLWLEKIAARATAREKCSSFINYPDLNVFRPELRTRAADDGRFVLSYPGTLNWHQGLDIAIRAFALVRHETPGMEFHIHGEGPARAELERLIAELDLADRVRLHQPVPLREVAAVMANADLGVVPKRDDKFGGEAFSTKILEFMALGVPLVVADTRIDRHYFDATLLRYFRAGDEEDLARVLLDAYRDRALGKELAARALEHVQHNSWGVNKSRYFSIVQELVDGR
ncbi:glycosyltransferase involved in cell wall biosynthesis [Rivibacter subsaxonicus]|uniref:Glycosyltransferase involved in cell wall biosynthesis n=2 Tax=Rivibacter subsaxonicus TaxID=457575 RepID=A0A4V2FU60_9BURK|nr:glycosyltransferase involved in cell wall biosynthesis [Rivibacter subsaxonicus]